MLVLSEDGCCLTLEFPLPLLLQHIALSDGKDATRQLMICLMVQLSTSEINLVTELKLSLSYMGK